MKLRKQRTYRIPIFGFPEVVEQHEMTEVTADEVISVLAWRIHDLEWRLAQREHVS